MYMCKYIHNKTCTNVQTNVLNEIFLAKIEQYKDRFECDLTSKLDFTNHAL